MPCKNEYIGVYHGESHPKHPMEDRYYACMNDSGLRMNHGDQSRRCLPTKNCYQEDDN